MEHYRSDLLNLDYLLASDLKTCFFYASRFLQQKEIQMANIGYARVSTKAQNLTSQLDRLEEAGCIEIYKESLSGGDQKRPELNALLNCLQPGDCVIVTHLSRLARSLKDLLNVIEFIEKKGAFLRSLAENVDTESTTGRLMIHVFGVLAEFERELIRERTLAGLVAARARGRIGGRPRKLNHEQRQVILGFRQEGRSLRSIARLFNVSVGTINRALEKEGVS